MVAERGYDPLGYGSTLPLRVERSALFNPFLAKIVLYCIYFGLS